MWSKLAHFVLKNRMVLIIVLLAASAIMGFFASKVKLSYEFAKAIPTDNPKYKDYQAFKQKFGDDGNMLVIGVESKKLFEQKIFNHYNKLYTALKSTPFVEDVLGVPGAVNLQKNIETEKLDAVRIFPDTLQTQEGIDAAKNQFFKLPFYQSLMYSGHAYLMGVRINKEKLNSPERTTIINDINLAVKKFETDTYIKTYVSGLPLIRTVVADRLQNEMKYLLLGSLLLSAIILLLFFRSFSAMFLSLAVVVLGVVWALGTMHLLGYQITLLTALVPPLVVVIGIPNCIYFINKYHTSYLQNNNKEKALVEMVSKMGVVTLFCNITAAIGFAVFALTKSVILKEFGVVAGISIMLIFVVSFILLPSVLSWLKVPGKKDTLYLDNKWVTSFLLKAEQIALKKKMLVYGITIAAIVFSIFGILRLQTKAFIVDDLPKTDKIYTDLKFFEKNFKGVMPLEIMVDAKKRKAIQGARALAVFAKADELAGYISSFPEMNRPLTVAEGLKFAKQAYYDGDTANYQMPNEFDMAFVGDYLRPQADSTGKKNNLTKMMEAFMDSSRQYTRISVSMADVGTQKLPAIIDSITRKANLIFNQKDSTALSPTDSLKFNITVTGTSITFLEGSSFIIKGLKESILWAFLLIAACMLYLFKSFRILLCSLIPNLIPLLITAGVMGWAGVPLKPSTVLVFSVALGIAIDITIRFLVNYKQELPEHKGNVEQTVKATIRHTGLSIVYTSLVLVAGFIIFCFSSFGGTFVLGWLTSLTLLVATVTNLVLLPVLLTVLSKKGKKAKMHVK